MTELTSAGIEPVVKTIEVAAPIDVAFRVFTDEIATWWPTHTHSIREDRVVDVRFEGRPGGRVYEVADDGGEASWGRVVVWEPPTRVVLAWNPSLTRTIETEVELTLEPVDAGRTRLRLEHRGWEWLGERATEARGSYDSGWDPVLARYAARFES